LSEIVQNSEESKVPLNEKRVSP